MHSQQRPLPIELHLLRHADAGSADDWLGPDETRPLNEKGRFQSEQLGRFLAERGFVFDRIVSSPKLRALQTAELVAEELGVAVTPDDRLAADFDVTALEGLLSEAGGRRVVLVGHDPDFSELAATLIGSPVLAMSKATLVRIDVSLPLYPGHGRVRWVLPPELLGYLQGVPAER